MKITMVGPFGFHPNKTMRARALPLARALVTQGHDVAILMPPWQTPTEAGRRWQEDGVQLEYTPLTGGILGITRHLLTAVTRHQPDIIHCFKPKAYSGLVAWRLWHSQQRPRLIIDTDDWEGWGGWNDRAPYSRLQKHFFAWQENWGLRHCQALTVASRHLQTLAWGRGVPPAKVHYLPNGSGLSWDKVPPHPLRTELGWQKRPLLLLYSRLFEFDVNRLTLILQQLQAQIPDLAILSIGTGLFAAEADQLRKGWADTGLLAAVHDLGWVEEAQLPSLLTLADAAIYLMDDTLLNRTKCPVKLADMIAAGLPVVAEDVGQVSAYITHEENGYLYPSGDTTSIVTALAHLLRQPERQQQLGQASQRHYQTHFAWSHQAQQLATLYQTTTAF